MMTFTFRNGDTLKNQILSSKGKMKKYFFNTIFEQNVMLLLQREQTIYFKRKKVNTLMELNYLTHFRTMSHLWTNQVVGFY